MKNSFLTPLYLCFLSSTLLTACGGGSGDTTGSGGNETVDAQALMTREAASRGFIPLMSLSTASLSDFNFNDSPDYVELRLFFPETLEDPEDQSQFEVTNTYDENIKAQLSETDLFNLNSAVSDRGFWGGCLPSYCMTYIAALKDQVAYVVDNQEDLALFLGEVDTPAEIHFTMDNNYSIPYFQETANGYRVLSKWFDCGGNERVEINYIDRVGNVTLEETLLSQNLNIVC